MIYPIHGTHLVDAKNDSIVFVMRINAFIRCEYHTRQSVNQYQTTSLVFISKFLMMKKRSIIVNYR